ncbi:hypothetical protein CN540_11860 [Bacillus toyonensis]|nr:hypothetical protein CN540_11860 [Bacillus toyonensis]
MVTSIHISTCYVFKNEWGVPTHSRFYPAICGQPVKARLVWANNQWGMKKPPLIKVSLYNQL